MDINYAMKVTRREGVAVAAVLTSNVPGYARLLNSFAIANLVRRHRGKSLLYRIESVGGFVAVHVGYGFFAGRQASDEQIKARVVKALLELRDNVDEASVCQDIFAHWFKDNPQVVPGMLAQDKEQMKELNKRHQKITKRVDQQIQALAQLAGVIQKDLKNGKKH